MTPVTATAPDPGAPQPLAARRVALDAALFALAGAAVVAALQLGTGKPGLGWVATLLLAVGCGAGGGAAERWARRRDHDAETAGLAALGLGMLVGAAAVVQGAYTHALAGGSLDRAHAAAVAELLNLLSCGGPLALAVLATPVAATVSWRRAGRSLGWILVRLGPPVLLVVVIFCFFEAQRSYLSVGSGRRAAPLRPPFRAAEALAVAVTSAAWACGPALLWALADRLERRRAAP